MTCEEFVRRWRERVAGMALFGVASEVKDGPLARATYVLEIPERVEQLLTNMWNDIHRDKEQLKNGPVKPTGART